MKRISKAQVEDLKRMCEREITRARQRNYEEYDMHDACINDGMIRAYEDVIEVINTEILEVM